MVGQTDQGECGLGTIRLSTSAFCVAVEAGGWVGRSLWTGTRPWLALLRFTDFISTIVNNLATDSQTRYNRLSICAKEMQ